MDSSNSCGIHDRLSLLPDSLILEILSLLPMNDVVGTMLLSKRWLHLWTTVPCLHFGGRYNSNEFVTGALAHWKGSKIRESSFTFYLDSAAMVDSWLPFAIEKQVEELHVCNEASYEEYCPPQHLYSRSSIIKMSLSISELRIDGAVHWSRLKRLEIVYVESLGDDAMNIILAGAPLLEELVLENFNSSENLNIHSTSLKILKFGIRDSTWFTKNLIVRAPNLVDLEISGVFYGTCLLDVPSCLLDLDVPSCLLDVPSLTNAKICFQEPAYAHEDGVSLPPLGMFHQVFQSIRDVEKLTLSHFSIMSFFRMKHTLEFPNLKSLSLYAGCAEEMLGILNMFPNLTTLWVQHDKDVFVDSIEELFEADLPRPFVPYLKRVEITWFMADLTIISALGILLENAKLLDKMVFRADWRYWDEEGDKPELSLSKPASSPTAEVTIIHV